jgi:hypothetical protein
VIVATIFFQLITWSLKVSGRKPIREWFYLGPVLAWTSFVLAVEKVSDLARDLKQIHPGGSHEITVPEDYVNSLLYAFLFLILWFLLYFGIQALHMRYEFSETDISNAVNNEADATKKPKIKQTMEWERLGFLCGAANILGVITVVLFHNMLLR